MPNSKQPWDTRAWLVGIIGGAVGGTVTAWATYPPLRKRLDALPSPLSADLISGLAALATMLVLPAVLSGIARRHTFLWGLVPLALFFIAVDSEDWIESGLRSVAKDWWISLALSGGAWLLTSGPVSLVRWLRARAVRRHAALLASYAAQREASAEPQEGVWPPPPNHKLV